MLKCCPQRVTCSTLTLIPTPALGEARGHSSQQIFITGGRAGFWSLFCLLLTALFILL